MLIDTTIANGPRITGTPFVIDIISIVYRTAITRKYTLAIFENYSNRFSGTNVKNVYFDVRIRLSGIAVSGTFVLIVRSIAILVRCTWHVLPWHSFLDETESLDMDLVLVHAIKK
jgi:hypothetical protein